MNTGTRRARQKGFVLVTTAMCLIAVIGITGLAVDLGRLYIVKNEAQAYADAAALQGVLELDGTPDGMDRARSRVTNSVNRWNMGTSTFSGTVVEFSANQAGPYEANPAPAGVRFLRVRATATVPLYLMPSLGQNE